MASRAGLPELLQLIIEGETVPDLAAENAIPPVGRCPSISPRPSGKTEAIPEKTHRCKSFRRQFGSQNAVLKSQTLEKLHYETSMTEPSDLGRLADGAVQCEVRVRDATRASAVHRPINSIKPPAPAEPVNFCMSSASQLPSDSSALNHRWLGSSVPRGRTVTQNSELLFLVDRRCASRHAES
ncbi:uncharacterized protein PAN0_014c5011 [Moesziomyces antarcticus]|uniref:Uncharacterized protein n=1 Tax=Pseudozyma antarctica TaxID=84753 RepID=A0A081CJE1_PSEA2|nr:uncharacterized protein PAN0_014c5011 [Moesziomyces antarcticus]GAK66787.1 hypothetical protein PAN0_014c5011 [Moesziomyces antarcticus]